MNIDEKWMKIAMDEANLAMKEEEIPVGAVLIQNNKLIARSHNQPIKNNDPTAHAEIQLLRKAGEQQKNYRLIGSTIYVTLEPCHMCAKAIVDARINHVYFAAREPKTGAVESIDKFFERDHLNHLVTFSGGHLEAESSKLLKSFFKSKRK